MVLPGTDGVLILRWFFSFTGEKLVEDALGEDCERCSPELIAGYLASLAGQLDVDGDGAELALRDALMIQRWLLGFTDDALIAGACDNCDPTEIETFLTGLM